MKRSVKRCAVGQTVDETQRPFMIQSKDLSDLAHG